MKIVLKAQVSIRRNEDLGLCKMKESIDSNGVSDEFRQNSQERKLSTNSLLWQRMQHGKARPEHG